MNIFISLILGIIAVLLSFKAWAAIKKQIKKQKETHRLSIEPSISFYIEGEPPSEPAKYNIFLKNIGNGIASNIEIKDFHHPKEKAWCFNFQKIPSLKPDEKTKLDYTFYVGEQKAFNKHDQLWMFDPDHDHDFIAEIVINFSDIDGNNYRQTNHIGGNESKLDKPRLQKEPKASPQNQ